MTVFAINKDLGFEEDDFKDLVDKKKKKLTELERALICLETEKLNLQKKIESLICNNNDLENELKAANNKKKIIEQELVKTEDKTQKQQAVIDELLQKLKQCDPGKIKKEHAKVKIKLLKDIKYLKNENSNLKKSKETLEKKIYKNEVKRLEEVCNQKVNTIERIKNEFKSQLKRNEKVLKQTKEALVYYKNKS